jgi:hypothetical protein
MREPPQHKCHEKDDGRGDDEFGAVHGKTFTSQSKE